MTQQLAAQIVWEQPGDCKGANASAWSIWMHRPDMVKLHHCADPGASVKPQAASLQATQLITYISKSNLNGKRRLG